MTIDRASRLRHSDRLDADTGKVNSIPGSSPVAHPPGRSTHASGTVFHPCVGLSRRAHCDLLRAVLHYYLIAMTWFRDFRTPVSSKTTAIGGLMRWCCQQGHLFNYGGGRG